MPRRREVAEFLDKVDAPVLIDREGVVRQTAALAGLSARRGPRRPRAGLGGRTAGGRPPRGSVKSGDREKGFFSQRYRRRASPAPRFLPGAIQGRASA